MPENVTQDKKKQKRKRRGKESDGHTPPTQDEGTSSPSPDSDRKDDKTDENGQKEEGHDQFTKTIVHSSQLDSPSFQLKGGEKVVVIGSGASGVEAVETVLQKFGSVVDKDNGSSEGGERKKGVEVYMVARDDKWIIPRNIIIDTLISGQPFGQQMPLRCVLFQNNTRYETDL